MRLSMQAASSRKLAVAGATGSKVMKLNTAMQYLTENSRFAGESFRILPRIPLRCILTECKAVPAPLHCTLFAGYSCI